MEANAFDELAPVIGYRATRVIAVWFAGRSLCVPASARSDHPLEVLLGRPAFVQMVRAFGGRTLAIPTDAEDTVAVPAGVKEKLDLLAKLKAMRRLDAAAARTAVLPKGQRNSVGSPPLNSGRIFSGENS